MPNTSRRRKTRKNSIKFKPSRKLIESAVDEYLKNGGKITRLKPVRDFQDIISVKGSVLEADEFLTAK